MIYHVRTLVILAIFSGASLDAAQLKNKQFIFGPVRVSPAMSRTAALATLYGSWKMLDYGDTQWLSSVRADNADSIAGSALQAGLFLAKAALITLAAERVYDYTHTVANYATWPAYASRLLQQHFNELMVIKALTHDVIAHISVCENGNKIQIDAWHHLIEQYKQQCEATVTGLMEVSWYIADDITVQLLEALRHDMDTADAIKLDRFAIMDFVRHDELLSVRMQALYAAFDHLGHAQDCLRVADVHVCQQELQVLHEMFSALNETRSAALTEALKHCNRIAAAKTTKDVAHGVLQYAQWRVANWWSADN